MFYLLIATCDDIFHQAQLDAHNEWWAVSNKYIKFIRIKKEEMLGLPLTKYSF